MVGLFSVLPQFLIWSDKMAITINIPFELEVKFRRMALDKFGDKKGRLSKGAIEALEEWCNKQN